MVHFEVARLEASCCGISRRDGRPKRNLWFRYPIGVRVNESGLRFCYMCLTPKPSILYEPFTQKPQNRTVIGSDDRGQILLRKAMVTFIHPPRGRWRATDVFLSARQTLAAAARASLDGRYDFTLLA